MRATAIMMILVLIIGLTVCSDRMAFAGSLVGWGGNDFGQATVPVGGDYMAIDAGNALSLSLKTDGSIGAWGLDNYGQATPPPGNNFLAVAAGRLHSIALKSDGSLVGWGNNSFGEATPPAGSNFVAIATCEYYGLALKSDGSLAGWGRNSDGQTNVPAGNDFAAIAAGFGHALALKSDGSIVGWGDNSLGQTNVPAGNDFSAIAAGASHSLALKSDGSIAAWGDNSLGQTNVPVGNDFVAIAAGGSHNLALKSDGSIVGWGYNTDGQTNVPTDNKFIAIAAGYNYSLAMAALPLSVAFTYQGRLIDANSAADGLYDLEFALYNDIVVGMSQGSTITKNEVDVIDGYFTVSLDFNDVNAFSGDARYIEIGVRQGDLADPNSYTILTPRQEVTPTPYAVHAKTAGGVPGGLTGSGTTGTIPKFTGSNTIGDSIICEFSDNVGIGTADPNSKLEVAGRIHSASEGFQFPDGSIQTTATSGDGHSLDAKDGSPSDVVYVNKDGNVGVGTTSPKAKLQVSEGNEIADLWLGGTQSANGNDVGQLSFVGHSTSMIPPDTVYAAITARIIDHSMKYKGALSFHTATSGDFAGYLTEQMRINHDGDVGIGTDDPTAKLHVEGTIKTEGVLLKSGLSATHRYGLKYGSAGNEGNSNDLMLCNRERYGGLLFGTSGAAGGAGDETERMRITYDGKLGIGTDSPGSYLLAVNGSAAKTGGGSWSTFSDIRLKEVMGEYQHGLVEICSLRPVGYRYKEDNELNLPSDKESVGLVAQEVQAVIPEAVEENDSGYLLVNNDPVIWAMVNAIQELKTQNEELKQRLAVVERTVRDRQITTVKEARK